MSRFHPAFPESAPADGGGTSGGPKGIGCGTRTFVQVARRNGEEHGSSIGESNTDSARHPSGNSEHQRFGASRVGQAISFDADDDRPGKFFGCIEQPFQSIGTVIVTVPDEQFSVPNRNSRVGPGLKSSCATGQDMVCVVNALVKQPTQVHPTGGVGHRKTGFAMVLGQRLRAADERNVAPRIHTGI